MKHQLLSLGVGLLRYLKMHRLVCPFFVGNGTILVMHRVLPERPIPRLASNSRIEITPDFLEQLVLYFIRLQYDIVSLDTVYERLQGGCRKRPFVCFTFDDGYTDAYEIIYPIFQRYQLPFAVYIVTAFPDRKIQLWWYMLEDVVLEHDEISFSYKGKMYSYPTLRHSEKEIAYGCIRELILSVPCEQLQEILEAVFSAYSVPCNLYEQQQMTWAQVQELADAPLVTLGGHTAHHYNLSQLTAQQVKMEIMAGKERLEEKTGHVVQHFAYPFGSRTEAGRREFDLAAECGFKTMTTVREGNIFPAHRHNLNCLPRVEITGRHQDLTLVDLRRCGLVAWVRNRCKLLVTE